IWFKVSAWSEEDQFSPGKGALPLGAKTSNHSENSSLLESDFIFSNSLSHILEEMSDTGNPFCAYDMAGERTSLKERTPNFSDKAAHVLGAPGTVTGYQPYLGIL